MAGETNYHLKLPEDLLIEIFLRSSVKSLLGAKCVCKHWYALISNGDFVYKHLQYQKSHDKSHLFLQYYNKDTQQYAYVVFEDETLASNSYRELDHIHAPRKNFLHLEGPVNGLYCLFNGLDRIVLWNPALMEARILPRPQSDFFPHGDAYSNVIGFGMDPSTLDYKLVLIRRTVSGYLRVTFTVTVYNLTTNTWKLLNLDNFDLEAEDLWDSYNSSFLDGIYYWLSMPSCVVIAFDIKEETFQRISGPVLADPHSVGSLTIYNDKVAYLQENQFTIDVWVMLEEGVWIKQFSTTSHPLREYVIGLWKNDELLLTLGDPETSVLDNFEYANTQIVLSSLSTQEMRCLGPKGHPFKFKASTYHESLVSVYSGTQHNERHASLHTLRDFFFVQ